MMQVSAVVDSLQVYHLQIHSYNLVTQLTSLIIGFNILVKIMQIEQVYTKRRRNSYSRKLPYPFPKTL